MTKNFMSVKGAAIQVRNIFIDCGANVGAVLSEFVQKYPDRKFYAFEPNEDLIPDIKEHVRSVGGTDFVEILPHAVWVRDGVVDLFVGHHINSTMLPGKVVPAAHATQVDYTRPVPVPALDFSAWLRRTIAPDDDVIVKMDIEGAEYPVLTKLVADGTIDLISVLYIEWHYDRFPAMAKSQHDRLLEAVAARVELRPWD
ncbi:FkbM family methyltransferase [Nonomuraea sp. NPDC046802]|uniref:FkbM family methyltransferase n=1 Tax=Nonomuraea sp. NPDC046802 TaxID=3154919 RepID=UPI0033C23099